MCLRSRWVDTCSSRTCPRGTCCWVPRHRPSANVFCISAIVTWRFSSKRLLGLTRSIYSLSRSALKSMGSRDIELRHCWNRIYEVCLQNSDLLSEMRILSTRDQLAGPTRAGERAGSNRGFREQPAFLVMTSQVQTPSKLPMLLAVSAVALSRPWITQRITISLLAHRLIALSGRVLQTVLAPVLRQCHLSETRGVLCGGPNLSKLK